MFGVFYFGMIIKFPEQQRKATPPDASIEKLVERTIVPLGLARIQAADYIGISPSLFDQLVADGRMPQPRMLNARTVWDRWEIEAAFGALPHRNDGDKTDNDDDDEWRTAV